MVTKKVRVEIGYEDCYFGDFQPVEVVEMTEEEANDRLFIISIGESILPSNYACDLAWRILD